MSYMRASFLMRKTRYVKTYVKWTELFGNREKATILNRGKSPYTKGVIVVDIVDKALRMGEGRQIKKLENVAKATNALEDEIAALDDEELKDQTAKFKQRIENGESLDKLMPEAFATVREASKRTLGLRHFDVQLMGGAALHWGNIAEMKTGEGKTLVATLPAYLNALDGQGVHVVTVNDYLASYQAELMGRVYRFLGMSTGCIITNQKPPERRKQYNADITYGTNNEFGFDYLRDNMAWEKSDLVQRGHHYAIVDEVDSILIDEARTPLIISGPAEGDVTRWYRQFARLVLKLNRDEDYEVDEKKKVVGILDPGITKVEDYLGIDNLYEPNNTALIGYLNNAIKAKELFLRDRDYVVTGGEVLIVDEHTGRILPGRRYNEGLHQAIEAKEGVEVKAENQTFATITLQNYFRLYDKLSGMTGTALTEDAEFREIYKLPVEVIPPNKPVQRVDHEDLVYRTIQAKYNAVADDVERRHAKGQPVLVGTVSIESSEKLSAALTKRGIAHEVLNAKHHEREAHIVAQAGRYGAVTIATNMAGRGTDILLGGNPDELVRERLEYEGLTMEDVTPEQLEQFNAEAKETCKAERERVLAAGGLTVIGTERHESRRIDNQLRGRSGRQGDPGETQFYLSLEDDLMRLFGGDKMDRVSKMMVTADMGDDMPIQHKIISKAVESAQHKVESINFSMRKSVLEYDDVMNKQRQVIYAERNKILDGKDLTDHITEVMHDTVYRCVQEFCTKDSHEGERDLEGLRKWVVELTGHIDTPQFPDEDFEALAADVLAYVEKCYNMKAERLGEDLMRELNTQVMLRVIDTRWMNYLQEMDYLKTGIGLRGFGQRDPLVEYKTEAYGAFQILVDTMYEDYLRTVLRIEIKAAPQAVEHKEEPALKGARFSGPAEVDGDNSDSVLRKQAQVQARTAVQGGPAAVNNGGKVTTYRKSESDDPYVNVGRNDLCPCGSGKKFKYCHGRNR